MNTSNLENTMTLDNAREMRDKSNAQFATILPGKDAMLNMAVEKELGRLGLPPDVTDETGRLGLTEATMDKLVRTLFTNDLGELRKVSITSPDDQLEISAEPSLTLTEVWSTWEMLKEKVRATSIRTPMLLNTDELTHKALMNLFDLTFSRVPGEYTDTNVLLSLCGKTGEESIVVPCQNLWTALHSTASIQDPFVFGPVESSIVDENEGDELILTLGREVKKLAHNMVVKSAAKYLADQTPENQTITQAAVKDHHLATTALENSLARYNRPTECAGAPGFMAFPIAELESVLRDLFRHDAVEGSQLIIDTPDYAVQIYTRHQLPYWEVLSAWETVKEKMKVTQERAPIVMEHTERTYRALHAIERIVFNYENKGRKGRYFFFAHLGVIHDKIIVVPSAQLWAAAHVDQSNLEPLPPVKQMH